MNISDDPMNIAALRACETQFQRGGYNGVGMDLLISAAGMSSRTLYKRFRSKDGLIAATLRARRVRFFQTIANTGLVGLFDALALWSTTEEIRGCLYLRAAGELCDHPEVMAEVADYHAALRRDVGARIAHDTGEIPAERTVIATLALFEGAAALCAREKPAAVCESAAAAAIALVLDQGRPQ